MKIVKVKHIKDAREYYFEVPPDMKVEKNDLLYKKSGSIDDEIVIAKSADFEISKEAFNNITGFDVKEKILGKYNLDDNYWD